MKKIALALTALTFAVSAFAESSVSFYNKLYEEDNFYYHSDEADENLKDFPQLKDEMNVEYKSDNVDAALTAVIAIDDYNDRHFGVDGYIDDWYVEWRLFQPFTLGFHDNIYSDGSYLPIYDDNMAGGNIGSDGLTAVYRPQIFKNALRLAATLPFNFTKDEDSLGDSVNWLKGKKTTKDEDGNETETDDNNYVDMGFGAIYTAEHFQLGATVKDVLDSDERLFGVSGALFGAFGKAKNALIGAGFTKAKTKDAGFDDLISGFEGDDFGLTGENIINFLISYETDKFNVNFEALTNLKEKDAYDLYTAVSLSNSITEQFTLTGTYKMLNDFSSKEDGKKEAVHNAGLDLEFQINEHNSIGAGFNITTCDKDYAFAVPVFWKWEL